MSRQNPNARDRKPENNKRDAASSGDRLLRSDKEQQYNQQPRRDDTIQVAGLDRNRLNDLYERSSI